MKLSITRIGNSKGIIIPAGMLKHCGFEDEVSVEVKDQTLIISPTKKPRDGWQQAFEEMGANRPELPTEFIENDFDKNEWVWQ